MIKKTVKKVPGVELFPLILGADWFRWKVIAAYRERTIAEAIEKMGYDVVSADSTNTMPADSTHNPGH